VAASCHEKTNRLVERLDTIEGVAPVFNRPTFHERVMRLPIPAGDALRALAAHDILGGYDLSDRYPELGNALLVCATEKRTDEEMDTFRDELARVIAT
jgi:glycine dehydrogenase subunit 1